MAAGAIVTNVLSSLTALLTYAITFYLAAFVLSLLFPIDPVVVYALSAGLAIVPAWLVTPYAKIVMARRFGRIYAALRRAEREDEGYAFAETKRILTSIAPGHPVGELLNKAHGGLHNLEAFTRWAEFDGVPEAITSSFVEQARTARDALWRCADRIARARKRGPQAAALLDGEAVNLAKLVEGARHARLALLELCVLALRGERDEGTQRDLARRGLAPLQEAARQLDSSAPHLRQ